VVETMAKKEFETIGIAEDKPFEGYNCPDKIQDPEVLGNADGIGKSGHIVCHAYGASGSTFNWGKEQKILTPRKSLTFSSQLMFPFVVNQTTIIF
jgi:hypothetical protein